MHDYKIKELDQHLRILISHDEDEGVWLAHCLEMDHVESAEDKFKAILNLLRVIVSELNECKKDHVNPFVIAPKSFWDRYWKARPMSLTSAFIEKYGIPRQKLELKEIPYDCH